MAKDPSQMTDEELDEAIANPPQDGLIPPVEVEVKPEEKKPDDKKEPPKKEEPVLEELEEPVAPAEEEVEEEEKPPSRREQLRIQDVLAKLKASQEAKVPVAPAAPEALDYEKALDADPELIKKLQADRQAANEAMYLKGIEQANSIRFHTRLEIDAPRIEAKYPQLDKSSDKFNPVLANAINTMFLSTAGYDAKTDIAANPDVRYSDYVESVFELASEIAGEETTKTKENIKKQAAQTAIRPDGSTTKRLNLNKLPEQMSDEELDARIALAIPPR